VASSASALAPLALVVLCLPHTSFAFVVLRKLLDQHAAEFRESPWRIVAKHGHDPLAVGKADCDDRVAIREGPIKLRCQLVAVEHGREQLDVLRA